jgi:ribonuclease III
MLELGYIFKDTTLLAQALTHPSASKRKDAGRAYERLEFLGDRVLGLVMADWLYALYPNEAEGELARRHAALVKRDALVKIAEALNLGNAMKFAKGEEASARGRHTMLADAVEAVIGAIFLDGGFKPAQKFIQTHFADMVRTGGTAARDAKTALQEWAQARKLGTPVYDVVGKSGPAHAPSFTIQVSIGKEKPVTAEGKSKQQAEQAAATALLEQVTK